jgi:hypothetical protein
MDKQHNSSELKYNIKSRMEPMTRDGKATIMRKVLKDTGMCRSSYYKALTIKHTDSADIPIKMLLAFSKAFNVKMEELFNKKRKTKK